MTKLFYASALVLTLSASGGLLNASMSPIKAEINDALQSSSEEEALKEAADREISSVCNCVYGQTATIGL